MEDAEELKQLTFELGKVMEEDGADAVAMTFDAIYRDSEPAVRQLIVTLATAGSKSVSRNRRQKGAKTPSANSRTQQRLLDLTAVKTLDTPPPQQQVIAIPAEGSGSGRERLLLHIGRREFSWVGSFERGNKEASTVHLMPDGRLFVSACGAGYILDLKSRALIEKIGDDVMTVVRDDSGSLLIVNHDDKSFECFGSSGRLWKTKPLGCGGFRRLTIEGDELLGEARQASEPEWTAFAVKLATGYIKWPGRQRGR